MTVKLMTSALSCFTTIFLTVITFKIQISSTIKSNAYVLENHNSYSLVIPVTNQNGLKSNTNGSQIFTVQAPKYHRVMIVIQQLHVWPEIDKDSQSYLQFVDSDGSLSKSVYGNIDPDDLVPQYLTGPRSFVSRGDTASLVFINLHPDHIRFKNERRVYAKAVFTAFRDTCSYRSMPAPENLTTSTPPTQPMEMVYRSCTTSSASGANCIAAHLFCDGNVNCADQNGNIGVDEVYSNCNNARDSSNGRHAKALDSEKVKFSTADVDDHGQVRRVKHARKISAQITDEDINSVDLLKKLIVDQEYDEHFTDLFKNLIIGFLGLCTTCILIAFVIIMFCFKSNRHES